MGLITTLKARDIALSRHAITWAKINTLTFLNKVTGVQEINSVGIRQMHRSFGLGE